MKWRNESKNKEMWRKMPSLATILPITVDYHRAENNWKKETWNQGKYGGRNNNKNLTSEKRKCERNTLSRHHTSYFCAFLYFFMYKSLLLVSKYVFFLLFFFLVISFWAPQRVTVSFIGRVPSLFRPNSSKRTGELCLFWLRLV